MTETSHRNEPLFDFLLGMGDNCLILGHRTSEWCGHAPALEEDIAHANVALDLIGQTRLWLELAAEIEGAGRTADDLAYLRDGFDFRNLLLVEQPNGDFAQTLMRQFLFDAWHLPMLIGLTNSNNKRIADIAEKASKEVAYHFERSSDIVIRLGDGSEESHRRMQNALDNLWVFTGEMLVSEQAYDSLVENGSIPSVTRIAEEWRNQMITVLSKATLTHPADVHPRRGGRQGIHSEHLGYILTELQFLQRAYPGATW